MYILPKRRRTVGLGTVQTFNYGSRFKQKKTLRFIPIIPMKQRCQNHCQMAVQLQDDLAAVEGGWR